MARIITGARIGFWEHHPRERNKPFTCVGHYIGPDLGDHIPGEILEQPLMEGVLRFKVGVLFRPDLGKYQRLETILILQNWIPEMFEYSDHWERATG